MIRTIVIATDGSSSVQRAISVALDLADRFDAGVYVLFVVDDGDVAGAPTAIRRDFRQALVERGEAAISSVQAETDRDVTSVVRSGRPAHEISRYAVEVDADVVVMGTRGRHGEHRYLLGSVTEHVIRSCPVPVLTVRHLGPDGDM